MPRVWALFKHWDESPPTHQLVRLFLGYKPKNKNHELSEVEESLASFPVAPLTSLPDAVQDWIKGQSNQHGN